MDSIRPSLCCLLACFLDSGKTHIAKRICRFLSFFHDIPSQIFNAGDYRRQLFGAVQPAQWYDPNNVQGTTARNTACDAALTDLLEYMKLAGVRVSAFDATNSTKERRKHVVDVLKMSGLGVKYMFVESICDEEDVRYTVLEHSAGYALFWIALVVPYLTFMF